MPSCQVSSCSIYLQFARYISMQILELQLDAQENVKIKGVHQWTLCNKNELGFAVSLSDFMGVWVPIIIFMNFDYIYQISSKFIKIMISYQIIVNIITYHIIPIIVNIPLTHWVTEWYKQTTSLQSPFSSTFCPRRVTMVTIPHVLSQSLRFGDAVLRSGA